MDDEPREYTTDEVREMFLDEIAGLVQYWDTLQSSDGPRTQRERLEGLAFGIMTRLDGVSPNLPAFIVAPCPHPDDREFLRNEGANWFPENDATVVKGDIAGGLHELLYRNGRHRSK